MKKLTAFFFIRSISAVEVSVALSVSADALPVSARELVTSAPGRSRTRS